jgi:uncharacterized coiled-coil protein SlyX
MTPSQQQAKTLQDEARRQQQADERIHELEKRTDTLRAVLEEVRQVLLDLDADAPRVSEMLGIISRRLEGDANA